MRVIVSRNCRPGTNSGGSASASRSRHWATLALGSLPSRMATKNLRSASSMPSIDTSTFDTSIASCRPSTKSSYRDPPLPHTSSIWCASVVRVSFGSLRASSAILRCRVEMTSRPSVPVIFPSASSIIRSAASLRRVLWSEFPDLIGTYQPTPTSRLPSRLTSFPSLGTTTASPSFAPPGAGRFPEGLDHFYRGARAASSTMEKTRYPRFLDDPCVHAPLFDPGGPPTPGHYRAGDVVFRTLNNVDSAFAPFEARSHGLHALCVRFAAGVAPGPRNTRFRLVANLDRSGLSPAGSHRWFTVMSFRLHGVLHHQASPGAI